MQVKSFAECSKLNLENTNNFLLLIKLPFVIKFFVLSRLEWPFYTGFTVTNTCNYITKPGNPATPDSPHYNGKEPK